MRLPELLDARVDDEPDDSAAGRRRRRVVVVLTLVVGSALLGATLRVEEGSDGFTVLGLLAAATWALGAVASGPVPFRPRRPPAVPAAVLAAAVVGGAAFVVCLVAVLVLQDLPGFSGALDSVLDRADAGSLVVVLAVALVNGAAEELFFRGAVHRAVGRRHRVVLGTLVYVAVTVVTGNLALVAAAVVMGALFTVVRQASGSVLAPLVTHLTWSTLMILALPR